jgi:hypothetical protein
MFQTEHGAMPSRKPTANTAGEMGTGLPISRQRCPLSHPQKTAFRELCV